KCHPLRPDAKHQQGSAGQGPVGDRLSRDPCRSGKGPSRAAGAVTAPELATIRKSLLNPAMAQLEYICCGGIAVGRKTITCVSSPIFPKRAPDIGAVGEQTMTHRFSRNGKITTQPDAESGEYVKNEVDIKLDRI